MIRAKAVCDCGMESGVYGHLNEMVHRMFKDGWTMKLTWPGFAGSGGKPTAYALTCPSGHPEPQCRLVAVPNPSGSVCHNDGD